MVRMGFGDRDGGVWLTEREGNLNFIIAVETRNGGWGVGEGLIITARNPPTTTSPVPRRN